MMTPAQLKISRKKLDLTLEELSILLGIDRRIVAGWESGERPIETMAKLAVEHLWCLKRRLTLRRQST